MHIIMYNKFKILINDNNCRVVVPTKKKQNKKVKIILMIWFINTLYIQIRWCRFSSIILFVIMCAVINYNMFSFFVCSEIFFLSNFFFFFRALAITV